MKMIGYQPQLLSLNTSSSIDYGFFNLLFEEENSFNWAEWLKPHIPSNKKALQEQLENEIKRIDILTDCVEISDLEKEFNYLDANLFFICQQVVKEIILDSIN